MELGKAGAAQAKLHEEAQEGAMREQELREVLETRDAELQVCQPLDQHVAAAPVKEKNVLRERAYLNVALSHFSSCISLVQGSHACAA